MSKNESAIDQINLSFNEQEDRLLLKLGLADKTEVTIWLTRRICKVLSGLIQGVTPGLAPTAKEFEVPAIATPEAKNEAIKSFSREATQQKEMQNLDFTSEYQPNRTPQFDAPMLVTQCAIVSQTEALPQLELLCANGKSVKIALNSQLVYALTNMMQLAVREAGWSALAAADAKEVITISSQQVLH